MPAKHNKSDAKEDFVISHIPDVFDEEDGGKEEKAELETKSPVVVEVEIEEEEVSEPAEKEDVVADEAEEQEESSDKATDSTSDSDLPKPSVIKVHEPHQEEEREVEVEEEEENELPARETMPEPKAEPIINNHAKEEDADLPPLPSFFKESQEEPQPEASSRPEPAMSVPNLEAQKVIESTLPQAVVGELHEVSREVKSEKRGALITIFIISGMLLVAAGLIGLYLVSTKRLNFGPLAVATPMPTPEVTATPQATPTVIVHDQTATPAAALDLTAAKKSTKVNVTNGTKIVGLAAKEAAVLKKAGFTLGTVGNGDPQAAGTIVVPTGKSDFGNAIKDALPDFAFTVTENAKAKDVTVTLDAPSKSAAASPSATPASATP